jgi:hypothetical protein
LGRETNDLQNIKTTARPLASKLPMPAKTCTMAFAMRCSKRESVWKGVSLALLCLSLALATAVLELLVKPDIKVTNAPISYSRFQLPSHPECPKAPQGAVIEHVETHHQAPTRIRPRVMDVTFTLPSYYKEEDFAWFHPLYRLQETPKRIAFMVTATGKYVIFLNRLIDSGNRFALLHHNVDFHVFSDIDRSGLPPFVAAHPFVFLHKVHHAGWPDSTINRFKHYSQYCMNASTPTDVTGQEGPNIMEYDYVFNIDADAAFVDYVGEELLTDWVSTMHIEV